MQAATARAATAGRRRLVVDACVVLKWQLDDEDDVERALALRDHFLVEQTVTLAAPLLLVYELTNAIRYAAVRARLDPAVEHDVLQNFLDCGIELHPPAPAHIQELAQRFTISGYDAAYLSTAATLGAELWTADRRLYDAARAELHWLRWIGDYATAP